MNDRDERYEREREERIRRRAYALWEQEGRPKGRDQVHWDEATELIAIEDNQEATTVPLASSVRRLGPEGEPIEEARAVRNLGEFPTMTDQSEQTYPPRYEAAEAAEAASRSRAGKSASSGSAQRRK